METKTIADIKEAKETIDGIKHNYATTEDWEYISTLLQEYYMPELIAQTPDSICDKCQGYYIRIVRNHIEIGNLAVDFLQ